MTGGASNIGFAPVPCNTEQPADKPLQRRADRTLQPPPWVALFRSPLLSKRFRQIGPTGDRSGFERLMLAGGTAMLRMILALALALLFAGTATAQPKADSQLERSAEIIFSKYLKAFNSADERALKNLYSPQAVTLDRFGVSPSDQTEQQIQRIKTMGIKLQGEVQYVQQIDADTVLSYGSYQFTYESPRESGEGTWMQVLENWCDGSGYHVGARRHS
jgi:hypothetical protein